MMRLLVPMFAFAMWASVAQAHMVYIVPAKDGTTATVVFSDTLEPDEKVKMDKLAGLKLQSRSAGQDALVTCTAGEHSFAVKLAKAPAMLHGTATYGLLSKAEKPTLLVYHPKAVFAGNDAKTVTIGATATLELVPSTVGGKTRLQLLAKGKPVAGAEGTVVLPDGTKEKVKTDAEGYTPAFDKMGRYAAYFKHSEVVSGEHDGKKYDEVRHYATLVVDVAK